MMKTFKKSFEVKIFQEMGSRTEYNDSEKKLDPRVYMAPPRGNIYVYYHIIQTSPLKPLGQLKPNFM